MTGKLSPSTFIPLGTAVIVLVSVLGGARWLDHKFITLEYEVQSLNHEVMGLKESISNMVSDRWRRADMVQWTELLGAKNKEMNVPVPRGGG